MTATGAIVYPLVCSPNAPCGTVPEVETVSTNGDYVAFPGDSGAVVFTVGSGTNRFAAGMVSTGSCDQVGCLSMNFVTAPDIYDDLTYSNLGLKLNPHT